MPEKAPTVDIKIDPATKKIFVQNQTWKEITTVEEFLGSGLNQNGKMNIPMYLLCKSSNIILQVIVLYN